MRIRVVATLVCVLALGDGAALAAQSVDALMARGRAQLDSGKAEAAITTFELIIARDDRNVPAYLALAQAIGAAAPEANVLRLPFLARRVRTALERVIELDPNNVDGRYGLVQYYLQAPGVLGGSAEKARAQADAMMRILPARGHIARAQVARAGGDTVAYERELRNAMRVAPDSFAGFSHLAFHFAATQRSADAIALVEGFLATHPDHVSALYAYGRLAARTGLATDRARAALQHLLTIPKTTPPDPSRPSDERVRRLIQSVERGTREAREEHE